MILTNNSNLPLPLFEALKADPYDAGDSDVTVTQLLQPAQQWALNKRYGKFLEVDACDRMYALYGQLMATLLERVVKASPELAARFEVERRVSATMEGWKVSGAYDIYDRQDLILSDYKFVGGYSAKKARAGEKDEWFQQLNMLRWLKIQQDPDQPEPRQLQIVLMVRDYTLKDKKLGFKPVEVLEIPAAPLDSVGVWIQHKVLEFQQVKELEDWQLPDCNEEETWNGKRCTDYCDVANLCVQNREQ